MSEVFMPVHDLGCRCWPHVSQRHADAAIVEAARREYVASRPDKAVSLQKASPKSGEVSTVSATAPSPAPSLAAIVALARAREAADAAVAAHGKAQGAHMRNRAFGEWLKENDRLVAEQAAAVAALRKALGEVAG